MFNIFHKSKSKIIEDKRWSIPMIVDPELHKYGVTEIMIQPDDLGGDKVIVKFKNEHLLSFPRKSWSWEPEIKEFYVLFIRPKKLERILGNGE